MSLRLLAARRVWAFALAVLLLASLPIVAVNMRVCLAQQEQQVPSRSVSHAGFEPPGGQIPLPGRRGVASHVRMAGFAAQAYGTRRVG